MKRWHCLGILLLTASLGLGCARRTDPEPTQPEPCSPAWHSAVEARVPTGDGHGHGPDLGSAEWQSVVEFKLGVRGQAEVPARDSRAWCRYIEHLLEAGAGGAQE